MMTTLIEDYKASQANLHPFESKQLLRLWLQIFFLGMSEKTLWFPSGESESLLYQFDPELKLKTLFFNFNRITLNLLSSKLTASTFKNKLPAYFAMGM